MSYTYEKSSYGLLPNGDYEMQLQGIQFKTTEGGKEYISLMFQVRDDVEQEGQRRTFFDSIWKEKENPEFFNRKRLNNILGTQEIEEGTQFNDINDIVDAIKDCKLIGHVKIKFNDYKGEEENVIAWYKPSNHKAQELGEPTATPTKEDETLNINSDDLPF